VFVQDRHGPVGTARGNELERDGAIAHDRSSSLRKKTCGLAEKSRVKNSASDIGMPSSTFFSELTDGLTRFCSIKEMRPLSRRRALPAHAATGRTWYAPPQVGADVDAELAHGVFNILHTRVQNRPNFTSI